MPLHPMSESSDERRRHARVRLDGRMQGRATVLADFKVVALSESGAALHMSLPMALGSLCDLSFNLSHVSVDLKGRVVRLDAPAQEGQPWEVDVEFLEDGSLDRGLLLSHLERERSRAV